MFFENITQKDNLAKKKYNTKKDSNHLNSDFLVELLLLFLGLIYVKREYLDILTIVYHVRLHRKEETVFLCFYDVNYSLCKLISKSENIFTGEKIFPKREQWRIYFLFLQIFQYLNVGSKTKLLEIFIMTNIHI